MNNRSRIAEPSGQDQKLAQSAQPGWLHKRWLPIAAVTIAVIAKLGVDEKIPVSERASTASCVCLLLLQAAQAEGFGAQWLTGWPAYDRVFLQSVLGLHDDEQLTGTIAMGTSQVEAPERDRPDPNTLISDWQAM